MMGDEGNQQSDRVESLLREIEANFDTTDLPADIAEDAFARVLANGLRRVATRLRWAEAARRTAATVDRARTGRRLLSLYEEVVAEQAGARRGSVLKPALARIVTEGQIIADKAGAFLRAVTGASGAATASGAESSSAVASPAGTGAGLVPVSSS